MLQSHPPQKVLDMNSSSVGCNTSTPSQGARGQFMPLLNPNSTEYGVPSPSEVARRRWVEHVLRSKILPDCSEEVNNIWVRNGGILNRSPSVPAFRLLDLQIYHLLLGQKVSWSQQILSDSLENFTYPAYSIKTCQNGSCKQRPLPQEPKAAHSQNHRLWNWWSVLSRL